MVIHQTPEKFYGEGVKRGPEYSPVTMAGEIEKLRHQIVMAQLAAEWLAENG